MKRIFVILCATAMAFGALGSLQTVFASQIVYDNTTTDLGYYSPSPKEYGDQITFGGTNRLIDDFKFAYWISSSVVITGDETAQIRFYANDTPSGAPGTLLYDSGIRGLTPTTRVNYFTLSDLSLLVPDTITWTVLFGGIAYSGGYANAGGLMLFDPPTVGSSDPTFWWSNDSTGFTKIIVSGIESPAHNFYAQFTANPVPEPATMLLLASGLVGLVGLRSRFKK